MTGVGQFGRSSCMDPTGRFRKSVITHVFYKRPRWIKKSRWPATTPSFTHTLRTTFPSISRETPLLYHHTTPHDTPPWLLLAQLEHKKIRSRRRALSDEEVKAAGAAEERRAAKKKPTSSLGREDEAEAPRKLAVDEAGGEAEKVGQAVAGEQRTKAKRQQQRRMGRANLCLQFRSRWHPPKPTMMMTQKSASFVLRLSSTPQLRHVTIELATFARSE
jgi:hypothetical protein